MFFYEESVVNRTLQTEIHSVPISSKMFCEGAVCCNGPMNRIFYWRKHYVYVIISEILIRDGVTSINSALMTILYECVLFPSDQLSGCLPILPPERVGISISRKVCFLKYYTMGRARKLSKLCVTAYFS